MRTTKFAWTMSGTLTVGLLACGDTHVEVDTLGSQAQRCPQGGCQGMGGGSGLGGNGGTGGQSGVTPSCSASGTPETCTGQLQYDICVAGACDPVLKTAFGAGYVTGTFGGPCATYMGCKKACPCNAGYSTCQLGCANSTSTTCMNTLIQVQSCTQTSGCTEPVCTSTGGSGGVGGSGGSGGHAGISGSGGYAGVSGYGGSGGIGGKGGAGAGGIGGRGGSGGAGGMGGIGGIGGAGFGGTGGIGGCAGLAQVCSACMCGTCPTQWQTCATDPFCASIANCASKTGCTLECPQPAMCPNGCYQSTTCQGVIDNNGGMTGTAMGKYLTARKCAAPTCQGPCGITTLPDAGTPAAGWWRFEERAGNAVSDSANGYTGTLVNGPLWTDGMVGGAIELDGVSQYVKVAGGAIVAGQAALTIEAWVNWYGPTTEAQQSVYSEGSVAETVGMFLQDGRPAFYLLTTSVPPMHQITAASVLTSGTWHHLAAVLDPAFGSVLYVDGAVGALDGGMNQAPAGAVLQVDIGANGGTRQYFYGVIDEARVFRYAKSASEIQADYSNGLSGIP